MFGTNVLLIVLALLALLAVSAIVALSRKGRAPQIEEETWPDVDLVVDLDFLRARPAELDQRISELAALSGDATLGARMRIIQLAKPPTASRPTRVRRRTRPLVAAR